MTLSNYWQKALDKVYFAFQKIETTEGNVYAYEALLRGYKEAGFQTIDHVFDLAYEEGVLNVLDYHLRIKALKAYKTIAKPATTKLFYNIDNRIFNTSYAEPLCMQSTIESLGLQAQEICFELSEKHDFGSLPDLHQRLKSYKQQNINIAIDDFGMGVSGMKFLYEVEPGYLKIDRFFIEGINSNEKKQHLVMGLVILSKSFGFKVIAEGIESELEYKTCKSLGCHLLQGYYLHKPQCFEEHTLRGLEQKAI